MLMNWLAACLHCLDTDKNRSKTRAKRHDVINFFFTSPFAVALFLAIDTYCNAIVSYVTHSERDMFNTKSKTCWADPSTCCSSVSVYIGISMVIVIAIDTQTHDCEHVPNRHLLNFYHEMGGSGRYAAVTARGAPVYYVIKRFYEWIPSSSCHTKSGGDTTTTADIMGGDSAALIGSRRTVRSHSFHLWNIFIHKTNMNRPVSVQ